LFASTFLIAAACTNPDVKLGNGDQNSNSTGGQGGTGGSSGSGGTAPGLCTGSVIGTPGQCTSIDALKQEASDLCASANQTLADVAYDGACDPGSAMFAKVVCCSETVPVPPPPPECVYEVAGNPGGCTEDALLKDQASEACLAQNLELVDITYDGACGPSSSNFAKYTCCNGAAPPPPPPACFGELLGDPVSCSDEKDLALKAQYLCNGSGAQLTSLSFAEACAPGSYHFAEVECCFPPTPPPNACFDDFLGDPGQCSENSVLEEKANAVCAGQNAKLDVIDFDGACGPAASNSAKFTCCTGATPPPPPEPSVCTSENISNPGCTSNDALSEQASDLCATMNTVVEGLTFDQACSSASSMGVKFVCCAIAPPPPPTACFGAGGEGECTSNDTLKQNASAECNAVGGALAAISYDDACGPDSSKSVKYTCCSPAF
jgi:hypothetical protein